VTASPTDTLPTVDWDAELETDKPWSTTVWDDPINLMSYVTYVFMDYFKYPKERADHLMLLVHNEGRAVVSTGTREEMERDVTAMHSYGLWATLAKD
jgi:ATP-dependent Clp protease adaptor protein ClpS